MKNKGNQDITQPLQVYSRKKIPVSQSVQVQSPIHVVVEVPEIVPIPTKNVTPSTKPNKPIDECEKPSDMDLPIALRKGTRACTKHPISLFLTYQKLSHTHRAFLSNLHTIPIPRNQSKALRDKKWEDAMKVEMEALAKNNTWELVKLPKGIK